MERGRRATCFPSSCLWIHSLQREDGANSRVISPSICIEHRIRHSIRLSIGFRVHFRTSVEITLTITAEAIRGDVVLSSPSTQPRIASHSHENSTISPGVRQSRKGKRILPDDFNRSRNFNRFEFGAFLESMNLTQLTFIPNEDFSEMQTAAEIFLINNINCIWKNDELGRCM